MTASLSKFSCVVTRFLMRRGQVLVVLAVLRHAVADVLTTRGMLLTLPPELLMRVPAIVRFLQGIAETDTEQGGNERTSASGGDDGVLATPAFAMAR